VCQTLRSACSKVLNSQLFGGVKDSKGIAFIGWDPMGRDRTVESGLATGLLDRIYGTKVHTFLSTPDHSGIFLPHHTLCTRGRHQDHVFAFFWISEF